MTAWQIALNQLASGPISDSRICHYCGAPFSINKKQATKMYCGSPCYRKAKRLRTGK